MARIGFVGLGHMGLPMAQNLVRAGHQVDGVDVNATAVKKLREAGGGSAETAKDRRCARPKSSSPRLPSGKEVRESILGSPAAPESANAGTLLIDSSTIDVETARAVAAARQAKGLLMLDAPVSGGVGRAQAGTLTSWWRQRAGFEQASVWGMGKTIVHAGGPATDRRRNLQQHDPRRVDDRGVGSFLLTRSSG